MTIPGPPLPPEPRYTVDVAPAPPPPPAVLAETFNPSHPIFIPPPDAPPPEPPTPPFCGEASHDSGILHKAPPPAANTSSDRFSPIVSVPDVVKLI